jgi:hypothetical protein
LPICRRKSFFALRLLYAATLLIAADHAASKIYAGHATGSGGCGNGLVPLHIADEPGFVFSKP